jgi:hypothetical protein
MRGFALTLLGALLCGAFWYSAWSGLGVFGRYSFFPLWLGYIVLVNGSAEILFQDSLFRRAGLNFLWFFVLSVPFWWFFESLNQIVQNWHYIFPSEISTLHFAIESSTDFSTVVPAVLSTTYLFFLGLNKAHLRACKKTRLLDARHMWGLFVIGILSLILLWLAPSVSFALVWIAPFLIIEPVLYCRRYPTLIKQFSEGRWILVASTMSATLFTGFWWECWNFYSLPKWIYTVRYVGFWKVFEMPVLGYLGYPFFGLIVFSYTVLALFLFFGDRGKLTKSVVLAFDLGREVR